jgi:hypothetical protein
MEKRIYFLPKVSMFLGVLLSIMILASCSKDDDGVASGSGNGSININGKQYSLMPSDVISLPGIWERGGGTLYVYFLDEKACGWLETFKFKSSKVPQVGDNLVEMNLTHYPADELYDHSEAVQKTWPKDWATHDYLRGTVVSGSLTVINIEKGFDGYITVKFDNLKTRNYIGEEYIFNGTVRVPFETEP